MEDTLNKQLDLPPDVSHYDFRIAGHTHVQDKIKLGKKLSMFYSFISQRPKMQRRQLFLIAYFQI